MSNRSRRRQQQREENAAIEAAEAAAKAAASIQRAPTEAQKLISGDMTYRPIGGNNPEDIGANTALVEFTRYGAGKGKKTTRIMIDNGVKFASSDGPYDALMVDTDNYFQDRATGEHAKEPVDAIVVTHAHEDHIGGIAHDVSRGKVVPDIYCTPLTQAFIEQSLVRRGLSDPRDWPKFNTLRAGEPVQIGDINIMPIPVSHSVSQSMALAITTPSGSMLHSGDYKADETLPIGPIFKHDEMQALGKKALATYGHERFDVMTADSTRAHNPGKTPTEAMVAKEMDSIVKESAGHRVVAAVMGRSTERILNMAKVAAENDRSLVIHGGSILLTLQALSRAYDIEQGVDAKAPKGKGKRSSSTPAFDMGTIRHTVKALLKDAYGIDASRLKIYEGRDEAVDHIPEAKQIVLATGTQGEPNAALPKAARNDPKSRLILGPNDVVVTSASTIPGNETQVAAVNTGIQSLGVVRHITTADRLVHSSGHGYSEDTDALLEAVKPKNVIPVHGSVELMEKNAERIATRAGELDLRIERMRNGDRVTIGQDIIVTPAKEPAGFLGIRNTIEDPQVRQWRQEYVYDKVDEYGKRRKDMAATGPANDRGRPVPGKRAG